MALANGAEAACPFLSFCTCTASATGVSFGNYDPLSPIPKDAAGTVTVNCTFAELGSGTYDISLSPGMTGTYATRKLTRAQSSIDYNLYTTAARTQVWGNGTGGTQRVVGTLSGLLSNQQTFSIHGRVPPGQNVLDGAYTDVIVVTVAY
ncbi:Csu type fimbrial protein [Brevundimonas sp. SL161]|uniref:Csu type fimbrial protein n=1 Tax=Brevundimonas sp. SL161 TaxID=2804613 RepID=UPI003CF71475